jgi:hypothetical protein
MGREQLEALVRILQDQLAKSPGESVIAGSWSVRWDKDQQGFYFDKCEWGGYCEERPSLIALNGDVLDKGGPLFG